MTSKFIGLTRKAGMGKTLQYILYSTVCIVSLIIGLICIWWFLEKPYTKEDFAVPPPFIVLVGLGQNGTAYYADIDATTHPKWINSGIPDSITDIAGNYGNLYTVTTSSGSQVRYGPYTSSQIKTISGVSLMGVSVDDFGAIAGNTSNTGVSYAYAASPSSPLSILTTSGNTAGKVKSVSLSGGACYAVDTVTGDLMYLPNSSETSWVRMTTGGGYKQVSFDGAVCAIKEDGTLMCADVNVGSPASGTGSGSVANWTTQGTRKFSQISLKGGRIIGLGTDGNIYFSNTYSKPTWVMLPRKEYTPAGLPVVNNTDIVFTKVILMYPSLDARRKRFAGSATACNSDEQRIGDFCYQACASGRKAIGTRCPYRRHHTPAIPSCARGDEYINGSCYKPCPTGYTASGNKCMGATTGKGGSNSLPQAQIIPAQYPCSEGGTIGARYIRIRPTTLESSNLCLSRVRVKDKDGNDLSLPLAGSIRTQSKIGTITGDWISAGTGTPVPSSIPIVAIKTVNVVESGITKPLKIYIAQYGTATAMIADDREGTAKFYAALPSSWRDSFWTNGTSAGNRASKHYVLKLHTSPVTTYATDGENKDSPINPSSLTSYISTGGANSYWEVDLGGLQQIKTIEVTGCLDKSMRGVRVELLYSSNVASATPLVTRTLGPTSSNPMQVLTFNYSTKEPGIETRCYDDCPAVNGLPSGYGGDQTCVSAPDGITSRSITSPLDLPDPICKVPTNEDGSAFTLPGPNNTQIGGWVLDPNDSSRVLACPPGKMLLSLTQKFFYPHNTAEQSYTLQNGNGVNYTAQSNIQFKCVVWNDDLCNSYGDKFKLRDNMCINTNVVVENDLLRNSSTGNPNPGGGQFLYIGYKQILPDFLVAVSSGNIANVMNHMKIPKIPENDSYITNPTTQPSNCKCYNGDGTLNKSAYIYKNQFNKNKCVKCSSLKDTFYPKGAASTSSTWSDEHKNKWMSLFYSVNGAVVGAVDPNDHAFYDIKDAKDACEANVNCRGITKTYETTGEPYFSLRAGPLFSTADEAGGTGTRGTLIDRTNVTPNDSSWVRTESATGRKVELEALHTGFSFDTTNDIPRSFADDYVGTFAKATTPTEVELGSSSPFDIIQMMSVAVLQAQTAWASFQNSVQNDTYYKLVGVERRLEPDKVSTDKGICVGQCDKEHSLHDDIQILYDSAASSKTYGSPAYILYGTTCHSNSYLRFPRPSIPAKYVPQEGKLCSENYQESGSRCIRQCGADTVDSGSSCTTNPKDRAFVNPEYRCPRNLRQIDSVCVHECPQGFTADGDYCQPEIGSAAIPSTINCTRTDYGYSAGSGSGKLNKWLCESYSDLTELLKDPNAGSGITGVNAYTTPDDIVCYADDPSTAMYYCSSIDDFINTVLDAKRENLSTSCDTLKKSYVDLSDNLTILMSAQTSATSATEQISVIETTLETVISDICSTGGSPSSATCTTLNRLLTLLRSTQSGGTSLSSITIPLQVGVQSRDNVVDMLRKYKCCSFEPEGTTYPWCPSPLDA